MFLLPFHMFLQYADFVQLSLITVASYNYSRQVIINRLLFILNNYYNISLIYDDIKFCNSACAAAGAFMW